MYPYSNVALLGPLGHGKSRLVNKVCGTSHATGAGISSCTRTVEWGYNEDFCLCLIGTPGFGSSEDVADHIAAQKFALEETPLSSVCAVVKFEPRVDILSRQVEILMDFLGSDDIRVIVTHTDMAPTSEDFDLGALKRALSNNLDMKQENICFVGNDTTGYEIATFISETLHEPIKFKISEIQIASVSGLSGLRKYNKPINLVHARIGAATEACRKIVARYKSYETDLAIIATQNKVRSMVSEEKETIFRDAYERVASSAEQNLIYGKAGISLSLALQNFIKITNRHLSWDVTDPDDLRNKYRKCPYCDAVYVLVAGCQNIHKCGGTEHIPSAEGSMQSEAVSVEFVHEEESVWVRYCVRGVAMIADKIGETLRRYTRSRPAENTKHDEAEEKKQRAEENGTRELNIFCGRSFRWDEAVPLKAEDLAQLGRVDLEKEGEMEDYSKKIFMESLNAGLEKNKNIFSRRKKSRSKRG